MIELAVAIAAVEGAIKLGALVFKLYKESLETNLPPSYDEAIATLVQVEATLEALARVDPNSAYLPQASAKVASIRAVLETNRVVTMEIWDRLRRLLVDLQTALGWVHTHAHVAASQATANKAVADAKAGRPSDLHTTTPKKKEA